MAEITADDVLVTQGSNDEDYSGQRTNRMFPVITFGDGALTYPATGVPLPEKKHFRLTGEVKRVNIQQIPGSYEWVYDADNYSLRAYARADGVEMSGAIAETSLSLEVVGT